METPGPNYKQAKISMEIRRWPGLTSPRRKTTTMLVELISDPQAITRRSTLNKDTGPGELKQPGCAQKQPGHAGSGHAGSGHAGSGHAGSGQTGCGRTDPGHTGSGHAGSGHAGSGHTGSGHTGFGHAGSGHTGSGHTGSGVLLLQARTQTLPVLQPNKHPA